MQSINIYLLLVTTVRLCVSFLDLEPYCLLYSSCWRASKDTVMICPNCKLFFSYKFLKYVCLYRYLCMHVFSFFSNFVDFQISSSLLIHTRYSSELNIMFSSQLWLEHLQHSLCYCSVQTERDEKNSSRIPKWWRGFIRGNGLCGWWGEYDEWVCNWKLKCRS